jgi:hypothetical protein
MVGSCANRSLPLSGRVELDHARLGSPIKPAVSNEYGRLAGPGWGIGVLVDVRFGASSRTSGHVRIVPDADMDIFEIANKEKAARRRLFNSKPVIVDQAAAINFGFDFRRYGERVSSIRAH